MFHISCVLLCVCVSFSSPLVSSEINIAFFCFPSHWYLYVFNVLLKCVASLVFFGKIKNLNLNMKNLFFLRPIQLFAHVFIYLIIRLLFCVNMNTHLFFLVFSLMKMILNCSFYHDMQINWPDLALHQSDCRNPNWVSAKTVHSSSTNYGQTTARFRSFFR